jgi:hypothetical protein
MEGSLCTLPKRGERKGREEEENPLEPRHPSFVVTRVTIGKLLVCRATTKDSV